jgi:acyl carrier protein
MSRNEFTHEFAEVLGIAPEDLHPETDLNSLPEWDSVAYLSAMILIDEKLAFSIRPDAISNARTFGDILHAVQSVLQD